MENLIFENNASYNYRIYALITSRCKIWNIREKDGIKVIQLNIFTEDEAMNYLKKSLENEDGDDLKSLMILLQRSPLELKQAVGYMERKNQKPITRKNGKTLNVQENINLYNEKRKEVLHKGHTEVDYLCGKTRATTWRVAKQKI
ncbi:uncharacterized protein LOC143919715 isoform X1 [Arctopsyche grandis]|uniref:uncharacterized protein LOC143919715 isoform X1 n=1 Tax=Arctopsyche grandis TaxID=121162 RepID=UPI00406D70BB